MIIKQMETLYTDNDEFIEHREVDLLNFFKNEML